MPVIRSAIRFWNDVNSVDEAQSRPTSTLRPSVYVTHVDSALLTSISSTPMSLRNFFEWPSACQLGDDARPEQLLGRLIERTKTIVQQLFVHDGDLVADPRADQELLSSFVSDKWRAVRSGCCGVIAFERVDQALRHTIGDDTEGRPE